MAKLLVEKIDRIASAGGSGMNGNATADVDIPRFEAVK